MSYLSKRIATLDARIEALAAESLPATDPVEVSFVAQTPMHLYLVAPLLLAVGLLLNLAGYNPWVPIAMGLTWGGFYAAVVRQHYVVLSGGALLVIRLARLSSKKVAERIVVPRTSIRDVDLRWRMLSGLLTVKATERDLRLQIASVYRSRGEDLVRRLRPDMVAERPIDS